ncbi:protein FAR-RED-ELONGATED HYPOCOTYL 1-LIKE isoform X2 [Citrus clementina]|uniref:protein FAR-RED-ELONGATED HYPOCOTYL 1-LIKE isoform X2 n=1 Tax=Citrus clementina TaxID=85681 RepID=UPI000CED644D|nr:protein FAR-RED-ELONGATED HYPOCOTYL 1-LIKE isoform X2 [Citrus x clementina]
MEVDNVDRSELNSFLINEIRRADVIGLNKKRKLQAEHLGLPIAKLKCSDGSFRSKSLSTLDEVSEVENLQTNIIKGGATIDGFEQESANSNIYAEGYDSSITVHGKSRFQAEIGESLPDDCPSSSSLNWASSSFKSHSYSSNSAAKTEGGSGLDHFAAEHFTEKEIGETLDSKEGNPNVYVLSSGRWSHNQETQSGKRKPTIDQEFEQYFSSLML